MKGMSEPKKDLKDTEPWTSVVLATKALTNPQGNEIFTLTELMKVRSDMEFRH